MLLLSVLGTLSLAVLPGPQRVDFGECPLRAGGVIENCHLDCEWFGSPDADGANVIVVPTWFGGKAEEVGRLMAHGGMVDNEQYALLAVDAFGDGVSSSPSSSATPRGLQFPQVFISDMVEWQHRLATEVWACGG